MPKSTYLDEKIINHIFLGQTFTPQTNLYVALFTSVPTDGAIDGYSYTEPATSNAYARQIVVFENNGTTGYDGYVWNATSTGGAQSITFGPSENNAWGTIYGIGVFDALNTPQNGNKGNCYYWSTIGAIVPALSTAVVIQKNKLIIGEE